MKNDLVRCEIIMLLKLPGRTYDVRDLWCPLPVRCLHLGVLIHIPTGRDSLLCTGLSYLPSFKKNTLRKVNLWLIDSSFWVCLEISPCLGIFCTNGEVSRPGLRMTEGIYHLSSYYRSSKEIGFNGQEP